MELGLHRLGRHVYYTFDPRLTQRICAGLLLSGGIALNPSGVHTLHPSGRNIWWPINQPKHRSCGRAAGPGLFTADPCSSWQLGQADTPVRCRHLPRKEGWAHITRLGAFSNGLLCRSLGLRCAWQEGLGVRETAGRETQGRATVRGGLGPVLQLLTVLGWAEWVCAASVLHAMPPLRDWVFKVLKSDFLFHQTTALVRAAV